MVRMPSPFTSYTVLTFISIYGDRAPQRLRARIADLESAGDDNFAAELREALPEIEAALARFTPPKPPAR
jgi:hypothetical protein